MIPLRVKCNELLKRITELRKFQKFSKNSLDKVKIGDILSNCHSDSECAD